jgi:hypothetical protein
MLCRKWKRSRSISRMWRDRSVYWRAKITFTRIFVSSLLK